jgi:hypothetical protein
MTSRCPIKKPVRQMDQIGSKSIALMILTAAAFGGTFICATG